MMYELSITNIYGDTLKLSQNPHYSVMSVTGLNPPTSNINTAVNASFDGSTYKSSRMNNRNIVIMMAIEGDIEQNRIELYKYIKSKQKLTVVFSNGTRRVQIDGYVDAFECNLFEQREVVQISIICPSPYFLDDTESSTFSSIVGLFEFPFEIEAEGIEFSYVESNVEINVYNGGDIETGMLIVFKASGQVVNPALYNMQTNEYIKLNVTMQEGDEIRINTVKGQKSVTKISGGISTNILNVLDGSSTWLNLRSGDNVMVFTATTSPENLSCFIYHNNLYEGV